MPFHSIVTVGIHATFLKSILNFKALNVELIFSAKRADKAPCIMYVPVCGECL